ncbi:histidinol dehydrogenase [Kineococcus gynurae]|uniref:Histidinol dehydrogenase n=1 Tax=Kineococcus gynurae TaxID=452979 RepID=A0ABV5LXZ7_9ACTN
MTTFAPRRIDLRGRRLDARVLRGVLPRADVDVSATLTTVAPICEDVRARGVDALREYTARFDGVDLDDVRVPREARRRALADLDQQVRAALEESIARARRVHTAQLPTELQTEAAAGGRVGQRWVPVGRVGLYVPGGRAVYPSSVIMNVVPAQIAGVASIAVTSPAQKDFGGLPHPTILAACELLGVEEVLAVGGAQAVAMFAYGVLGRDADGAEETVVDPVDVITGPGNVFVAAAKRYVQGTVGIDSEAGPTEIAVLADDGADPDHVAADLISQAEHDPLAAAVLVTDSSALADAVDARLEVRVPAAKHADRIAEALRGRQSAVVLVDDVEAGVQVVDAYAAEHLEIQTRDAAAVAARIRNAGAVFVGAHSPVSLGDYCAGSNHVLPTGGTAAHSGGLGVHAFLRGIQVIDYDETALREVADHVVALAESEDLPAHGQAVVARFPGADA